MPGTLLCTLGTLAGSLGTLVCGTGTLPRTPTHPPGDGDPPPGDSGTTLEDPGTALGDTVTSSGPCPGPPRLRHAPRNPGTLLGTVTSPLGTLSPHGWGGAAGDAVRHPPPPRCRTRGHPGTPRPSLLTPGHVTATSRCHRRHPRPRPPRRPARRPLRGVPASPCRPPARPPAPLTRTEPPGSVPCRPVAVPRLSPRRVMAGNEPHYSCLGND